MNEDYFWEIIEKSDSAIEDSEYPEGLVRELKKLKPQQIIEFYDIYTHYHDKADIGDVWAAGMLLNGGHGSDDGFEYFRNWLISQGRAIYEKALIEPDSLASVAVYEDEGGHPFTEWEGFGYAADYAYEDLTKRSIHEDTESTHTFSSIRKAFSAEKDDWDWQDYTDEVLASKLPRLWLKYGKFKIESDCRVEEALSKPDPNSVTSGEINGIGLISVGDTLLHRTYGVGLIEEIVLRGDASFLLAKVSFSGEEHWMIINHEGFANGLWSFQK